MICSNCFHRESREVTEYNFNVQLFLFYFWIFFFSSSLAQGPYTLNSNEEAAHLFKSHGPLLFPPTATISAGQHTQRKLAGWGEGGGVGLE